MSVQLPAPAGSTQYSEGLLHLALPRKARLKTKLENQAIGPVEDRKSLVLLIKDIIILNFSDLAYLSLAQALSFIS